MAGCGLARRRPDAFRFWTQLPLRPRMRRAGPDARSQLLREARLVADAQGNRTRLLFADDRVLHMLPQAWFVWSATGTLRRANALWPTKSCSTSLGLRGKALATVTVGKRPRRTTTTSCSRSSTPATRSSTDAQTPTTNCATLPVRVFKLICRVRHSNLLKHPYVNAAAVRSNLLPD